MLQNIPKEKILEIVRQGPTFPAKVAKALGGGGDTMLIGAILSTLISSGDLKVSSIKIGGSPLYYIPEQESKLEDFLNYLNEKDKKTFRLLKEEKILQDSLQDPLTRVSLRTIKDFAKSFEIDFNKQKVLFWRFYSLSRDEAMLLAKAQVKAIEESATELAILEKAAAEKAAYERAAAEKDAIKHVDTSKTAVMPESTPLQHIVHESRQESAQALLEPVDNIASSESNHEPKHDSTSHKEKHAHTATHTAHEHKHHELHVEHPESPHEQTHEHVEHHTKIKEPETDSVKQKSTQNFFELIQKYVLSKNLDIISKEKIKKTEYDLILKNHEKGEYIYCKAKDKSSINEGDLAPALIFAQNKKMPCLFISTGDLSKSAELTLVREFKGMTFEKIIV